MTDGRGPATGSSWLGSGLQTVLLPSGYQVRLVLPDVRRLVRNGVVSTVLLEAVLSSTDDGGDPVELSVEERDERARQNGELVAVEICWAVRESGPMDGELEPTTLTPDDLARLKGDDLDVLEKVITRQWTPERATRISRIFLGLDPGEEQEWEDLAGYADFRDDAGGGQAGGDDEVLEPDAEPAAGDTGPDGGAGRGRGPGGAPDDGSEGGTASGETAGEGEAPAGSTDPRRDALRGAFRPGAMVTVGG